MVLAAPQRPETDDAPAPPKKTSPFGNVPSFLSEQKWMIAGALIVAMLACIGLVTGGEKTTNTSAPISDPTAAPVVPPPHVDPSAPPSAAPVKPAQKMISVNERFKNWKEYRDEYFFAALPPGWSVTGATANGIDVTAPDGLGTASFGYVKGSEAGAMAYGAPTDNEGYAHWILNTQHAENVQFGQATSLGSHTDAVGMTWTFDGREFDATLGPNSLRGVLEVGTAHDAYGDWVGMAWERVAREDRWDALKDDLAAIARSITILKVTSSGGSIRMPATDTQSGTMSATQDDVESRLSQQREDATMGGQYLTDDTTGDRYWAPFEAYDASRGGYFIDKSTGPQQLTTDY